jgi:hypothetical protein
MTTNVDFAHPVTTDQYATLLSALVSMEGALGAWLRTTYWTMSNPPTGTIRLNDSSQDIEHNTGSAGAPTWTRYALNYLSKSANSEQVTGSSINFTQGLLLGGVTAASTSWVSGQLGAYAPTANPTFSGVATFGGAAFTTTQTVSYGTTTNIDCSTSNAFRIVFGAGNITTLNLNNPHNGQAINVRFKQDGTGGRTVTWPASFRWNGGTTPLLSTPANAIDFLSAQYDSTDGTWVCNLLKGVQ